MREKGRRLILGVSAFFFLGSAGFLIFSVRQDHQLEHYDKQVRQNYTMEQKEGQEPRLQIDFDALLQRNSDVRAWLDIPGTRISYPILKGQDNNTYLRTDLDHQYSIAGSLFIDAALRGDFSEPVNLIYGHHMHNGSMFADLRKYRDEAFYTLHPDLYLYLPDGQVVHYQAVAQLNTTADSDVYTLGYQADEQFVAHAGELLAQSAMGSDDNQVEPEDRLLLLSTCEKTANEKRIVLIFINKAESAAETLAAQINGWNINSTKKERTAYQEE